MSPYNLAASAVKRAAPMLDEIIEKLGSVNEFEVRSGNAHMLAYTIREAIAAAKFNRIDPYQDLNLKITEKPEHIIIRNRGGRVLEEAEICNATKEYTNAVTAFDVVTEASKAEAGELIFPSFQGDIRMVERWAAARGYEISKDPLKLVRRA